jgi:hypothetical protein
MDYNDISPKYIMDLVNKISPMLWEMFPSSKYQNVRRYVEKWHEGHWTGWNGEEWDENFHIYFKDDDKKEIDLDETLHNIPNDVLVKMAIDLGIDTPGFLPIVSTFKNILKDQNQSAYQNFQRATKNVYENPDNAVALAASTLEGIIKTILSHDTFKDDASNFKNKSLSKLVAAVIQKFNFNDKTQCPQEIITIASQLRSLGSTIDDLRSDKSTAHGKAVDDYVIDDPLWAMLTVNTSATLGLFLWEYFEKKYLPSLTQTAEEEIDISEIPF